VVLECQHLCHVSFANYCGSFTLLAGNMYLQQDKLILVWWAACLPAESYNNK